MNQITISLLKRIKSDMVVLDDRYYGSRDELTHDTWQKIRDISLEISQIIEGMESQDEVIDKLNWEE